MQYQTCIANVNTDVVADMNTLATCYSSDMNTLATSDVVAGNSSNINTVADMNNSKVMLH